MTTPEQLLVTIRRRRRPPAPPPAPPPIIPCVRCHGCDALVGEVRSTGALRIRDVFLRDGGAETNCKACGRVVRLPLTLEIA